ncbi:MAG: hypothetical protein FJW14_14290 [Acidimicrobiia bacterium]|nr:hypothetical protein [Acidimicrobiia bacterium]
MNNLNASRMAGLLFVLLACASTPAFAQMDLTGVWNPIMHEDQIERAPGPEVGDYLGLPINDAGRMRGETWNASILTLSEHTCKPHPSTYGPRGVGGMRIRFHHDNTTENLVKIDAQIQWMEQFREIWMDGRPHPPAYAAHTWQGFSTGRFEGNVLVVNTTHLKAGWIRRNGMALSDRATMQERFFRHGNYLTHTSYIWDPVYFTEPIVRTNGFQLNTNAITVQPYPCLPAVEVAHSRGDVPHFLPGKSGYEEEFAKKHKLPVEAARGGAETAYPEYMRRMRAGSGGGQ